MSKTNDTSKLVTFENHDMKSTAASDGWLRDAELTDMPGGGKRLQAKQEASHIGQVCRPMVTVGTR